MKCLTLDTSAPSHLSVFKFNFTVTTYEFHLKDYKIDYVNLIL